ncbi:hypothetical protein HAX54_027082 [Datura stramonium]|uniref:Uncharacterized protein n=1 Tax=Datura stramonium TaxID=4076 RepID=A0ABS8V4F8_DATST|nr:hypothetical protein [Datura stramonium]
MAGFRSLAVFYRVVSGWKVVSNPKITKLDSFNKFSRKKFTTTSSVLVAYSLGIGIFFSLFFLFALGTKFESRLRSRIFGRKLSLLLNTSNGLLSRKYL